ncbi:hypothetical protein GCM10022631_04820 [Deinococcus rubellus]|uniref:Helix-turn-helix transcriptional regulator n=1 Tax=Deinococcus rubellus TaxID=1889240 RepID=A0ABY5YH78_9DEIO|nr:helix-turn-helix transcriptional regulator [Deinococcus rubellus]UWX64165.1 helix-turn-helix transcriptional regulator [Deinococcus rubellus]
MAVEEPLNKFEAGQLIRARREALGYTQTEVVENTTITVETYVSELENGKVSVGRSKHFPSLARFLKLSEDEIRSISPSAVFSLPDAPTSAPRRGPPIPPVVGPIEVTLDIPNELQELIDQYSDKAGFEALRNPKSVQMLALRRAYMGEEDELQTVDQWLDYFMDMRRWLPK